MQMQTKEMRKLDLIHFVFLFSNRMKTFASRQALSLSNFFRDFLLPVTI